MLWECVFDLISHRLLGGLVSGFDRVGVLDCPLGLSVSLVKGIGCVLRGHVAGGPIWYGFARVMVSCGLNLLLSSLGWVGWCWDFALPVGGARVP